MEHANRKHGMVGTRFYRIWSLMKQRCLNSKDCNYKRYGARGIKISKSWIKFENFRDDMYKSYIEHIKQSGEKQTTIDRINNDGNYCKRNCQWATMAEQGNKRRNSNYLTFRGEKKTIAQWARKLGHNETIIRNRIKRGWPLENVLLTKKFTRWTYKDFQSHKV